MTDQAALLLDRLTGAFATAQPSQLGIAVSGGSDSLALLVLACNWAGQGGPTPIAVTVDHGLRAEAAEEADHVARVCRDLGVEHTVLKWRDHDGSGNLPDKARRARYGLIATWAEERRLRHVAVAHTLNDQAETFVMRLSRAAGVDGLAAMAARWRHDNVEFHRPLLDVSRNELRAFLRMRGLQWVEDPTNSDDAYERARVRKAIETLSDLGLSPRTLSTVAHHMSDVRATLYWYVFLAARTHIRFDRGDVLVDWKGFRTLPRDITRRLVQEILKWLSGSDYPPRGKAVDLMLESIRGGNGMTLQGCVLSVTAQTLRFTREANAVATTRSRPGALWDGRWCVNGPWSDGCHIAALGEAGVAQLPARTSESLPYLSLLSTPAVWRDAQLVAAPLAGLENGWSARLERDEDRFFAALLAH